MKQAQILLIEPDLALADIYEKFLTNEGYIVDIRQGAQQAINAIDGFLPDIIIMELQLAGHGGYEFLYELRSYPEWQSIPVILNTLVPKHALNLDPSIMKQLNISSYLYKPTAKLDSLSLSIDRCLVTV